MFLSVLMLGCKNKKVIVAASDNNTPIFTLTGKATRAPFSSDPNFSCYLNIPVNSFSTGLIFSLLVFRSSAGHWGFIYKNLDKQHVIVKSTKDPDEYTIEYAEGFSMALHKPLRMEQFNFTVVDQKIILNDVDCVLFLWDSGSLSYYGFKNIQDGITSSFNYKYIKEKKDKKNSGEVYFTEWNSGIKDWPKVERIEQFGNQ
jgi:hypothetical protein